MAVILSVPRISGRTPKCAGLNSGAQFVPVKNSATETVPKNSSARREQGDHDPDRGQDRERRAQGEEPLAEVLAPVATGGAQPAASRLGSAECVGCGHAGYCAPTAVSAAATSAFSVAISASVSGTNSAVVASWARVVGEVLHEGLHLRPRQGRRP